MSGSGVHLNMPQFNSKFSEENYIKSLEQIHIKYNEVEEKCFWFNKFTKSGRKECSDAELNLFTEATKFGSEYPIYLKFGSYKIDCQNSEKNGK